MKQEASKSDRNLSFCGSFLHQLHPGQAEFTKLDSFLAAVELYPYGLDGRTLVRLLESAVNQLQLC